MAPNGALEVFLRLIQTLPAFWAERIWILRIFMFDMCVIPVFENFHFFHFLDPKFLDFQVPRFPKSGLGRAGLGPWAGLGPSGGTSGGPALGRAGPWVGLAGLGDYCQ